MTKKAEILQISHQSVLFHTLSESNHKEAVDQQEPDHIPHENLINHQDEGPDEFQPSTIEEEVRRRGKNHSHG